MEWFYTLHGRQTGPVSEMEFDQLVAAGVVLPETLVWHIGMPEWKSYRDTPGAAAASPPNRIGEGVPVLHARRFGGFWIRFAAIFIDGLILGAAALMINSLLGAYSNRIPGDITSLGPGFFALMGAAWSLNLVLGLAYHTYFISQRGATPGKMAFGLRVIASDGGPISVPRAIARYFCYWLDSLTLAIGYIIAAFDSEKRALHDHICDTRVIYTR